MVQGVSVERSVHHGSGSVSGVCTMVQGVSVERSVHHGSGTVSVQRSAHHGSGSVSKTLARHVGRPSHTVKVLLQKGLGTEASYVFGRVPVQLR